MINCRDYDKGSEKQWNEFISDSRNGHFMFNRSFMEYHSDRFSDRSLMFYDQKDKLIAVMPANINDEILYSHQGLTFGGLILGHKTSTNDVLSIFEALKKYCFDKGIKKLIYKRIPDIYSKLPCQDDLYALFRNNAKLIRRDVNSTVSLGHPYSYSKGRKWTVKKAAKENIEVVESDSYEDFWELLSGVLKKHGATPTHALEEIESLSEKFTQNIRLFLALSNGEVLAGSVLFINDFLVHTQYMASSDHGREIGALDYLIHTLMTDTFRDKKYFDFGISTEDSGKTLNSGLLSQKNGFGAKTTVHDFYEITINDSIS